MLVLDSLREEEEPVELMARVVWCQPVNGGGRSVAGLRIYPDEPTVGHVLSFLARRAAA